MNALSGLGSGGSPLIPENAPFNAAQRSWLNGFLAGLYGGSAGGDAGMSMEGSVATAEEDFPWHDPAMEMDERLQLAEGRPFERKLMAAMAQLDCGQCGYLCQSYAEALASGKESSLSLCVPGAKPTSKKVKELLAGRPADSVAMAPPPAESAAPTVPLGMPVRVLLSGQCTSSSPPPPIPGSRPGCAAWPTARTARSRSTPTCWTCWKPSPPPGPGCGTW